MRIAILLVILVFAGCHKSYKDGARSYAAGFKKMGSKVAAVAKRAVPGGIDADVDAKLQADVVALAKQHAHQRVVAAEPITIRKTVHRKAPAQQQQQQPAIAEPTTTIVRRDASGGSDQVWKNLYRDGEKATCEKVSDFDSCQATCSEHMRHQSMRQLAPDAGKPVNCQCTQGHNKCG